MRWWYYAPLELEMRISWLEELETYVLGFQNDISQYIVTHLILEMCLAAKWWPGTRVACWWWEYVGIVLKVARVVAGLEDAVREREADLEMEERGGGGNEY